MDGQSETAWNWPVWASFTSLQSATWRVIDIKGHRRSLLIIRWTWMRCHKTANRLFKCRGVLSELYHGLWLVKCCKIQQRAHLYSTTYIYFQQDIFLLLYFTFIIFVILLLLLLLYSTKCIFIQLPPTPFWFKNNICSTWNAKFIFCNISIYSTSIMHSYLTYLLYIQRLEKFPEKGSNTRYYCPWKSRWKWVCCWLCAQLPTIWSYWKVILSWKQASRKVKSEKA